MTVNKSWRRDFLSTGLIFLFFLLLSFVITYPIVLRMRSSVYGISGDPFSVIWYFWWLKYAWASHISPLYSKLIASPFGISFLSTPASLQPVVNYPGLLLSWLVDEVFAYNFLIVANFFVAALTMYYLVHYLTRNKLAGLVAGVIYTLSPYHLAHAQAHLYVVWGMQWLPLFLLALFKLRDELSYKNAIFLAVSFSLVALSSYFDGFFALVILGSFVLFVIVGTLRARQKLEFNWTLLKLGVVALILVALIVLPFTYSIAKTSIEKSFLKANTGSSSIYARSISEVYVYSARLWEYLVPSVESPIFGRFAAPFRLSNLHESNLWEQTIFLGYLPLALAILAFVAWRKGRSANAPLLGWIGLVAMLFSLPPKIHLPGLAIPMPSFFTYPIAPMFRCYVRFSVVVMLVVSVLAGIGTKYLLEKTSRWGRVSYLLVPLILIVIGAEFMNVPPSRVVTPSTPPAYQWLAKQPDSFTIAEYPMPTLEVWKAYDYLFYQRLHQKRLVNGALPGTQAEELRVLIEDVSNPRTPSILSALKVKYVLIHLDKYPKGREPKIRAGSGLKLVEDFGATQLFAVNASPLQIVIIPSGNLYQAERWDDGRIWRWAGNDVRLLLINNTRQYAMVSFKFSAISFAKPRYLYVVYRDRVGEKIKISTKKASIVTKSVRLKPGQSEVVFRISPAPQMIDSVLHNGDERVVSAGFSAIEVEMVQEGGVD